jgi:hypothetical protein
MGTTNESTNTTNNKETTATTTESRKTVRCATEQQYIIAVHTRLRRALSQRARANNLGINPDEVANRCIEKLQLRLDHYMGKYPDPVYCANALARLAFEDYWRDEAIQSCQGARKTRRWERGDADLFHDDSDGGTLFDNQPMSILEPDSFIDTDLFLEFISDLRVEVGSRTWDAFMLIFRDGRTQSDAAALVGVSRETLNRNLSAMRTTAEELRKSPKYKGWV